MKKYPFLTYQDNFLKEFSDDILKRCILWDRTKCGLGQQFYDSLSEVQKTLNLIIQELNLKIERNIPYIVIDCLEYVNERTRISVRDQSEFNEQNIMLGVDNQLDNFANITHIIDCFQAAGRALIKRTNLKHIDTTIYFDKYIRDLTIIDILLDIAFFNSFSFLRELSVSEKKEFSKLKFEFYLNEKMETVFEETKDKDLGYYSFAFSCHKTDALSEDDYKYEIDIEKYISIWDKFINRYYAEKEHKEISVEEQIKRRKNNHMPDNYYHEFDNVTRGIYYILRTEDKNISPKYIKQVLSLFGKNDMTVAHLTYIKSEDFNKYVDVYQHAGISVFKIVVP